ncbi:MAG: hypothetical protein SNJ57_13035 [Cyanobacteriota bacterium]
MRDVKTLILHEAASNPASSSCLKLVLLVLRFEICAKGTVEGRSLYKVCRGHGEGQRQSANVSSSRRTAATKPEAART